MYVEPSIWRRLLVLPSLVGALGALPLTAMADDAPVDQGAVLQEVVVTAQKREQRLIDVPMSISVVSADQLTEAGINNVQDLSFAVPSLEVWLTSPAQQMISVRGIASQNGSSPLTGLYLDEMPLAGVQDGTYPTYPDLRFIDLDRVEVLKGPQGTLYGEGAAGGLIRFITKDPDLTRLGGYVSGEVFDTEKGAWSESVTGVLNLPIAPGALGIRIAAQYEDLGGWIDQPSTGRTNINDDVVKHFRLKALFAPIENLRITGLVEISRNDFGASNVVNQVPYKDSIFLQAVDRSAPTNGDANYDLYNLTATYDFGFAELLSSTSYTKSDSTQNITELVQYDPAAAPYLEVLLQGLEQESSIAAQEFRLTSKGTGPFGWTIGGEYKKAKLTEGYPDTGGLSFTLFGGTPMEFTLTGLQAGTSSVTQNSTWAGFADASYRFGSHVEVGGGLRYSSFKTETWDPNQSPRVTTSVDDSKPTYRAYAKYNFSHDTNVYFTVGSGFRAGGVNTAQEIAAGAPPKILPEETLSYELGLKTSGLEQRLLFTAAAFYTKYKDMIADKVIIVNNQTVQFEGNGQSAKVQGLEMELDWVALDRLTLMLSGDVTHTEITQVDPADPDPLYVVGDPINNVPKYTASVGGDYRFQWAASVPGHFRLSLDQKGEQTYTTRVSNGLVLATQVVSPRVSFLSASLEAQWSGWNWSIFGRNLLNEYNLLNANLYGLAAQARPRAFGVSVSKEF